MKENPWSKRHAGRKSSQMKITVATRRRDKAREALFAAGWKPSMVSSSEDKYHPLLLALNAANEALTMAKLGR